MEEENIRTKERKKDIDEGRKEEQCRDHKESETKQPPWGNHRVILVPYFINAS